MDYIKPGVIRSTGTLEVDYILDKESLIKYLQSDVTLCTKYNIDHVTDEAVDSSIVTGSEYTFFVHTPHAIHYRFNVLREKTLCCGRCYSSQIGCDRNTDGEC